MSITTVSLSRTNRPGTHYIAISLPWFPLGYSASRSAVGLAPLTSPTHSNASPTSSIALTHDARAVETPRGLTRGVIVKLRPD